MGVRFSGSMGAIAYAAGVAIATGLTTLGGAAFAQDAPTRASRPTAAQTPLEVLDDAFFRHGGTFYENEGLFRRLGNLIGPFPENNIAQDAADTSRIYSNLLVQQAELDPTVRTADLENPFTTSLLTLPTTAQTTQAPTIEFAPPPVPTVPQAPVPVAPQAPVRALY